MTARYFSHSPRGFANEITIYAVDANEAADWKQWFSDTRNPDDRAETALVSITRKQAEYLLRRDGVHLAIDALHDSWMIGEGIADTLNPQSVASACRCAVGIRADWEEELAYAAEMDAAYPEFAVTPR